MLRKFIVSTCAAVFVAAWASEATAQGPVDKRTYFTFSQPITLPGVTLQAGTYLFRLADPTGSRRVVQVLSEDGKNSYAMLLSIPAHRVDIPEDPEIHFMETPSSIPAAVKIWWYPGETTGHEFIYPEQQAMLVAKGRTEPILMAHAPIATIDELNTAALARATSTDDETPVKAADALTSASPIGSVRHDTLPLPSPLRDLQAVGTTGEVVPRTELPQTASPMPVLAFVATISLLLSVLGSWRRRRARN